MAYIPQSKKGRNTESPIKSLISKLTANKKIDDINNLASISNANDTRLTEAESNIVDIEQGFENLSNEVVNIHNDISLINNELNDKEPLLPKKEGHSLEFLRVSSDETYFEYAPAGGGFSGTMDDITDGVIYVKTENNYSNADVTKLAGIASGAEVNVNADWTASSGDAQILNKPTIPSALSDLTDDSTHRIVTDTEKSTWNGKQNALGYTPVNKAGDSMSGLLVLSADPSTALGAATKQYVDNIVAGINFHYPAHVATTGNLSATYLNGSGGVSATLTATSNGALIIDGHTMVANERVLVWQQSTGLQNGIYDVTQTGDSTHPFILTRSSDADNSPAGEIAYGDFTFIQQGSTYGGFGFICNTSGTISIGFTSISYVQFNAAQVITAGYGLQESTPNVISINTSIVATVLSTVPYTGATSDLQMGNHSVTSNDGSFNSLLSPNAIGVQNTAGTLYGLIDYSKVEISNTGTGNTMLIESTGITYPDLSIQSSAGVTSVTGTSPIVSSGGLTPAISIPKATASVNGYLSSTDFSTFNGKQAALSGSGIVKSTSGTISYITDNSSNWDTAYTNRITSLTTTGSSGASTLISNTLNIPTYTLTGLGGVSTTRTISTTAPLSGGGDLSANRTLSISQATTSTDGYLSSTDWNTFNGKQNTFSRKINGVTFDATSDIQIDSNIASFQALGSVIKAQVLGLPIHQATLTSTLTSQQGRYIYIPIPVGATITGVKFYQSTAGVYTANNYNGVGLYTISGGTLTLVASSTNDGNIWKGTANTWQTKAFTTPYIAAAGVYFLGMLYSSSAQTTAPVILSHSNMVNNAFVTMDFANSVKLVGAVTGQTALPASLASSGITANIAAGFAAYLY